MNKTNLTARYCGDGTMMSMTRFIDQVKSGVLRNNDGYGLYSDGQLIDPIRGVKPRMLYDGKLNKSYSHIVWCKNY